MIINPTKPIDFTTYGEALLHATQDLGTATPHEQVLKLLSWLFSVPLATVRADCQETWIRARKTEQNRARRI